MTALCHPNRPHVARGLCSACYQRRRKDPDAFASFEEEYARRKEARITDNARRQVATVSAKRRGPKWRDVTLRARYGLSSEEYERRLAAQNGVCFICEQPPKPGTKLYVDHCHRAGVVRHLLCPGCNTFVGLVEKRGHLLERVLGYVTSRPETPAPGT